MGDFEAGIARARAKEIDNQRSAGARDKNTATKTIKLSREIKSNPKRGGGINRPLAGKP